MFEKFRKKKNPIRETNKISEEIEHDILEIGDIGVRNAIQNNPEPVEVAITRLDFIRLKGEEKNMQFVATLASKQIDRIMEAKG